MGERLERLWPSLVALVGTIAVVLGLLWFFDDDVNDSTPDDVAAGDASGAEDETGAGGGDEGTGGEEPTEQPTDGDAEGSPDPEPTSDSPTTAPPELREPIGVLNQTTVDGLAEFAQERLEEGGWEVPAIGPFDNGNVPETTVYYPEGMQEAAEALAAQFPEIGRVRPNVEPFNDTRLVVVLVDDYVEEVGEPE